MTIYSGHPPCHLPSSPPAPPQVRMFTSDTNKNALHAVTPCEEFTRIVETAERGVTVTQFGELESLVQETLQKHDMVDEKDETLTLERTNMCFG